MLEVLLEAHGTVVFMMVLRGEEVSWSGGFGGMVGGREFGWLIKTLVLTGYLLKVEFIWLGCIIYIRGGESGSWLCL